jgi:hypothetical protein
LLSAAHCCVSDENCNFLRLQHRPWLWIEWQKKYRREWYLHNKLNWFFTCKNFHLTTDENDDDFFSSHSFPYLHWWCNFRCVMKCVTIIWEMKWC